MTLVVILCASGEVKKETKAAAGQANINARPQDCKKSGVKPKLIKVTHNVIKNDKKKDIMTVNKIRCFMLHPGSGI